MTHFSENFIKIIYGFLSNLVVRQTDRGKNLIFIHRRCNCDHSDRCVCI